MAYFDNLPEELNIIILTYTEDPWQTISDIKSFRNLWDKLSNRKQFFSQSFGFDPTLITSIDYTVDDLRYYRILYKRLESNVNKAKMNTYARRKSLFDTNENFSDGNTSVEVTIFLDIDTFKDFNILYKHIKHDSEIMLYFDKVYSEYKFSFRDEVLLVIGRDYYRLGFHFYDSKNKILERYINISYESVIIIYSYVLHSDQFHGDEGDEGDDENVVIFS